MQIICGKPKVNDMFFLKTSKPQKKTLTDHCGTPHFFLSIVEHSLISLLADLSVSREIILGSPEVLKKVQLKL